MKKPLLGLLAFLAAPGILHAQGGFLGPEFRVNTYTTYHQWLPAVAVDGAGNFVVVWNSDTQDGSASGVFAQRYASDGTPLGAEFRVNTHTPDFQRHTSVASDPAGNFVVAWESAEQDGESGGVFAQRYAADGAPLGGEFRVNTYTTANQTRPSVAIDPAGNFVVVWNNNHDVAGQRYASSGGPLGGEFRVNSYTTGQQGYPSVASDSAGNFVVVWWSSPQGGSGSGIFGQRYSSIGAPLGAEFRVNSYTANHDLVSAVASDPVGNFVVVYASDTQDGSAYGVYAQRYSSTGVPAGGEFRVNTYTFGFQTYVSVAADSSGNFVVVWQTNQDGGGSLAVFGQRYASTGAPMGGEFRVNSYTTSHQRAPSVAADPAGNFVVAWLSYTQDGSGYGIFAQRYSMIVPVELQTFVVE